jgi:hypothetical protein
MPMVDLTLPRGTFELRFGVNPGDERWEELRFDQR